MNEHDTTEGFGHELAQGLIGNLADEPMPDHLHGKIMKRVFLAGYGKYLLFCVSILLVNLSVLALDLYRAFTTANAEQSLRALGQSFAATPAYFATAASTIYSILPIQSVVATALTLVLATYIAVAFARVYKNPTAIKVM